MQLVSAIDDVLLDCAFERSHEAMLILDPMADRIIGANVGAADLLDVDRAELMEIRVSALHPGQLGALIVFTQAVLAKGRWWTHALTPSRGTGRPRRLEYGASLLTVDPPIMLVTLSDLDEREHRRVDLEAKGPMQAGIGDWQRMDRIFRGIERENRLILRAAGEGIYGVDAQGITIFVNPAAERMLGWKSDELVGREMHAAVHHAHPDGSRYDHHECPIYAAFRDGAVHRIDDEVFWRKDGTPFFVEYTSTPICDGGRLLGAVVVFRDVSQRRESEECLRNALAEVETLRERLERENAYLKEEIRLDTRHRGIVGTSRAIQETLRQVDLVASTSATVLVTGESGTGKELIARAVHDASPRRERPLIRVNCAAVPRELFESEFFGHVRGAFTGALRDRVGRFELADGGTLLLDEVGEIPFDLQGKLLRVLQERQFERVGEERPRTVDVRIIAATNRNLQTEVAQGRFREDLYFRLNVFPIAVAPLRERVEDIPLIASHLVSEVGRRLNRPALRLTKGDADYLQQYDWPGNVRELENVIERAAILSANGRLQFDLPVKLTCQSVFSSGIDQATEQRLRSESDRRAAARAEIEAALLKSGQRVFGAGGAAELLGLKPTTLLSRIKALKIERPHKG